MNNDFDILINGAPLPAIVQMEGGLSQISKFTLVAGAGAAAKGTPWSIDTQNGLVPLDSVRGQLDLNGRAVFTMGPFAMLGSILRGNVEIDVKVGTRKKTIKVQVF